jgi:hypothetical protein
MPIGPTSGFLDFTNATPRADVIIALSNVGVGTDVPLHALDIRGTANVADIIINNDLTLIGGLTTNTLTINSVSMSTTSNFQQVTNVGDAATTNTVQFTNPTTGLAVTSNVEVGGELSVSGNTVVSSNLTVSGNVEVGTANLFVDTTTGNVGVGTTEPTETLDIVGNLNLQKVSNTASIKLNSNVVTEYTRSKKLIKYPRVAMTAATTAGYTASASSQRDATYPAYQAFNNIFNSGSYTDGWVNSTNTNYNGTDNSYNPSADTPTLNLGIGAVDGEWLKLELPVKVLLQSFKIYARWNDPSRAPEDFRVYGSNDNANWTELLSVSGQQPPATGQEYEIIQTNVYYKYFGLVVTKIWGQINYFTIDLVEYYGIPEYDPEAHGTDVIMRSVPNVPNTDWLEVYYDGQDSSNYTLSGSAVTAVSDLSTNNRDCTASGVTIDSTWNAFRFDGSTSEIKVEDFTISGGDFVHTTSLWLYKDEETSQKIFYFGADVLSGSPSNDSISALNTDGSGYLQWYHWGNDTAFNVKLYPNNWYHVVLVYPGGTTNNKTVYVNGQSISPLNSGSGNPINLPTTIDLFLGRGRSASPGRMKGMIANFRIQNRALSADEIWQLYAYQKEYFDVLPDVVTFKGGRLGIGTSEPRAVLDVRGDIYGGCPVFFSANRSGAIDGAQDVIYNQVHYNKGGGYSGTTGKFTAPLSGYYKFNWHDLTRNSANSTSIRPYINNNTVTLPNSTGADRYGVYDQSSDANYRNMAGSWIVYLNTGDTFHIRLIGGNLNSNYNCFNGFYLSS